MSNDTLFMTQTMARIQEDQGRWEEAAKIYRSLLERDPHNDALLSGLERVHSKIEPASQPGQEALVGLMGQWLELILLQQRSAQLRRVQKRLRQES